MNSFSNKAYHITSIFLWKIVFTTFLMVLLLLSDRCSYAQVSSFQSLFCSFVQNFLYAKKNNICKLICTSTFLYVRKTVGKMTLKNYHLSSSTSSSFIAPKGPHTLILFLNLCECKCEFERTAKVTTYIVLPEFNLFI